MGRGTAGVLENGDRLTIHVYLDFGADPATPASAAKYDLTLGLSQHHDGTLRGEIEYATALFAPQTIQRLAAHLTTLLRGLETR